MELGLKASFTGSSNAADRQSFEFSLYKKLLSDSIVVSP